MPQMTLPRSAIILITCLMLCLAKWPAATGESTVTSKLRAIETALQTGKVTKLEVFFTPYGVETRIPITPDMLEQQARKKIVLASPAPEFDTLLEALRNTRADQIDAHPDLRWGLVLYDEAGARTHSIYLDGQYLTATGRNGYIDGTSVILNSVLMVWFENNFF